MQNSPTFNKQMFPFHSWLFPNFYYQINQIALQKLNSVLYILTENDLFYRRTSSDLRTDDKKMMHIMFIPTVLVYQATISTNIRACDRKIADIQNLIHKLFLKLIIRSRSFFFCFFNNFIPGALLCNFARFRNCHQKSSALYNQCRKFQSAIS